MNTKIENVEIFPVMEILSYDNVEETLSNIEVSNLTFNVMIAKNIDIIVMNFGIKGWRSRQLH